MIPQPRGPSDIATHNHTDTINVLPSPQLDDDVPLLDLGSDMTIDKTDRLDTTQWFFHKPRKEVDGTDPGPYPPI